MSDSLPRTTGEAFGGPGIPPKWTSSSKDGVSMAYSAASRVWFTISHGILNEVYYPTIDHPQIRDLQLLFTDEETFFHEERRDLPNEIEYLGDGHNLGYLIASVDPEGRYKLTKEIICDPHQSCLLIHVKLAPYGEYAEKLRAYVLLSPHLEMGGSGNSACRWTAAGQSILVAWKGQTYLALGTDTGFSRTSCGFVGVSDGWRDLRDNMKMDWEFECANDGNIAVMGQIDLSRGFEFTIGLAFGHTRHAAVTTLVQSLTEGYAANRQRFLEQWSRTGCDLSPLEAVSGDGGRLYRISHKLLLAHEDKTFAGAFIASASIPWGEVKGDEDLGGYHLVWTRDMVHSANALLAYGDTATPCRALVYLACSQRPDGGFPQNLWLDGRPYWSGVQLDEVAFPIMLAWRLWKADALGEFDPYSSVLAAAGYIVRTGPMTGQERWEENSGYSPSTLAACISALVCAADFARDRGDEATATFLEEYADFLESHVERWTVTSAGGLVPGIARHYIRIHPTVIGDPCPDEDPNHGVIQIANRPPGQPSIFPARDIVDAGFLELVRYGIRKPGDALIEDSLKVVDAALKVDTPVGPCWRRYNNDGYGQGPDGEPFEGWGQGRAWPLLTGERGHYELAAGREVATYVRAIEGFASHGGMIPEQVWDAESCLLNEKMCLGRYTGSAMPLMWAHAEYLSLLRSAVDGQVFDLIPVVADRYLGGNGRGDLEVWSFNRQVRQVARGYMLRIIAEQPFVLHWTRDEWLTMADTPSTDSGVGIGHVDIPVAPDQQAPIRFTFYWPKEARWEGRDYFVGVG
jgi:glucoamylase